MGRTALFGCAIALASCDRTPGPAARVSPAFPPASARAGEQNTATTRSPSLAPGSARVDDSSLAGGSARFDTNANKESLRDRPQAAPPEAAQMHAPTALSGALSRPAADRVVAIGDLHGDIAATRKALRLAGAIGPTDAWVGGNLVLVQTGDAIDRGDNDRDVLDLLEKLRGEAKKAGGELVALSGNHELMNVALDFRYVSPASFSEFSSPAGRTAAFRPGGPYAKMLAERPVLVRVGDTVFVHGGILPKHVAYGLNRMNDEVRAWMLGERPEPPAIVVAEDGIVWSRAYSLAPQPSDCAQLEQVLTALDAKRMVVGHTVQKAGVNAACDGRVWRIDVGLAGVYGGPTQVLEIKGPTATVRQQPD